MISKATIQQVTEQLSKAAPKSKIILFGSQARGDAHAGSDLDILVIEPVIAARRTEMVRLSDALRSLHLPVDIVVASQRHFDEWSNMPGTVFYKAALEGKVLYDAAG